MSLLELISVQADPVIIQSCRRSDRAGRAQAAVIFGDAGETSTDPAVKEFFSLFRTLRMSWTSGADAHSFEYHNLFLPFCLTHVQESCESLVEFIHGVNPTEYFLPVFNGCASTSMHDPGQSDEV